MNSNYTNHPTNKAYKPWAPKFPAKRPFIFIEGVVSIPYYNHVPSGRDLVGLCSLLRGHDLWVPPDPESGI